MPSAAFLIRTTGVLLCTAVLVVASMAQPAGAAPGWTPFRHPLLGFSISYPPGWELIPALGQTAFVVGGPRAAGVPNVRLGVVVVMSRQPGGAELDEAEEDLIERLTGSGAPVRVLRRDRFALRGIPAVMVYFVRTNQQGVTLYQTAMILIYKDRGYAVAGTTAADSTKQADETRLLQSIILTFQPR